MLDGSDEDTIKVIIIGDGFAGKTSLLRRFVRGDFTDQYKKTIGAEFFEKDVFLRDSNSTIKLMLWDTAGQEVFNALTRAYYRGAGAAILVFSTVDRASFENVVKWKERVEAVCGPVTMVLCQTKFDLSYEAAVTIAEAEGLAKTFKIPFYRVSSKDDFNVTQLFEFTAQRCLSVPSDGPDDAEDEPAKASERDDTGEADARPALVEPTAVRVPEKAAEEKPVPVAARGATADSGDQAPAPAPSATGASAADPPGTRPEPKADAQPKKRDAPSQKVSLNEPEAVNVAEGKTKKKNKKRCTLL